MTVAGQQVGRRGEAEVCSYLQTRGYDIVARNWHSGRYGELDIVAQKGGELFVIEVKTRSWPCSNLPEQAVNQAKTDKLYIATQAFIVAHPQFPQQVSLWVAAVLLSQSGVVKEIKLWPV